jgi:cytochrome c
MDSFEINKIIGGLLATVFVILSLGIVSDAIFAAPIPEKPGYAIEAPEDDGHGGPGNGSQPSGPESVLPLLASADLTKGAEVFKRCGTCHTGDKGGANKAGPNLWGVVTRAVASHEGFGYSAGMKAFAADGKVWDYTNLDHFLFAPKATVKGTTMGFAGVKKTDERANLIAYLRTLADTPAPLQDVPAPAAEGVSAPAGGEAAPATGHGEAEKPAQ